MSDAIEIDCAVIGAGVVGLAVARELQRSGREVFLFDAEERAGTGASSRNSEVIHAGIYYPVGSLKAALCVRGKHLLYEYCVARDVPFKRIGKLIVSVTAAEEAILASYQSTAIANGVSDLRWLSSAEVRRAEPEIVATAALLSPSTGIIDSHRFIQALLSDFLNDGGQFIPSTRVVSGAAENATSLTLIIDDGTETSVKVRTVINCAGLHAPDLAREIGGEWLLDVPQQRYAIGHYFSLSGPSPFRQLVYPIAARGGLGVHVTLDLAGVARFGPDIEWVNRIDYTFDHSRKPLFVDAIRRYYPTLDPERLTPAYTGIRAKISGQGEPSADFLIQGPEVTGHEGLVNLFGIESPGLTASLAIAEHVAGLLQ